MLENRKLIYGVLFGVFFLLEAIHLFSHLIPPGSPIEWIKPFGHYAPISLAVLLVFIIRVTEHEKERLEEALTRGADLVEKLARESNRVNELSAQTGQIAATARDLANQLRSSDALLHGKLFYFQRQYTSAVSIFDELYRGNQNDVEISKWLGLSLLRDEKAERAISLLEFAARSRPSDAELWFAAGDAKFRTWDRRYFESAEQDIQKALGLGFKDKDSAHIILAKLQLARDPSAAKATLQDAISHNPGSPALVKELSRIFINERNWNAVIEMTDRALSLNQRNWAMYPLRAEAFIRRGAAGDLDRAQNDISEAKTRNRKDFNAHRVEVELLLAKARTANSPSDSRATILGARARLTQAQELFGGALRAKVLALQSRLSLLLGESDDAVASARQAIEAAPGHNPNNHLLYCAALTQKRSWVLLSKGAQRMRELFPVPALQVWAGLYTLLAGLHSNETSQSLKYEIAQLERDLAQYPGFDPAVRPEWTEAKWDFDVGKLATKERQLALTVHDFLLGRTGYDVLVNTLKVNGAA